MIKKVEFNVTTNHVNMIFHDDVPSDYAVLDGYEILEKECEQLVNGGWKVFGHEKQKTETELLREQVNAQQAIIDELLFEVIPALLPTEKEVI